MSRTLSNIEKETAITFNKEESMAYIFTYEKTWQRHLETKLGLQPVYDNGFGGKEYEIDKSRIKPPRSPKKLSVKQRRTIGERLQKGSRSPKSTSTAIKKTKETPSKG